MTCNFFGCPCYGEKTVSLVRTHACRTLRRGDGRASKCVGENAFEVRSGLPKSMFLPFPLFTAISAPSNLPLFGKLQSESVCVVTTAATKFSRLSVSLLSGNILPATIVWHFWRPCCLHRINVVAYLWSEVWRCREYELRNFSETESSTKP